MMSRNVDLNKHEAVVDRDWIGFIATYLRQLPAFEHDEALQHVVDDCELIANKLENGQED